MIEEIINKILGKEENPSQNILKQLALNSLMAKVQASNEITKNVTSKLVTDAVNEIFKIKKRHKVTHF